MKRLLPAFAVVFLLFQSSLAGDEQKKALISDIVEIEKRINSYVPDGRYPDDPKALFRPNVKK